jgi:hypothetical protein
MVVSRRAIHRAYPVESRRVAATAMHAFPIASAWRLEPRNRSQTRRRMSEEVVPTKLGRMPVAHCFASAPPILGPAGWGSRNVRIQRWMNITVSTRETAAPIVPLSWMCWCFQVMKFSNPATLCSVLTRYAGTPSVLTTIGVIGIATTSSSIAL